jgi:hypothetical protein
MKKILSAATILFLIACGWMMWMSFLNTRTTTTQFIVSGAVDEVTIYRSTEPEQPVLRIETNGQATTRRVELRTTEAFSPFVQSPPAQYYFVIRAGEQAQRGRLFCCETGLHPENGTLTVKGLADWDFAGWARP